MIVKINNRVIGELVPEYRVFKKTVDSTKHLFLKLDAWGIDGEYFRNVLLPSNYMIEIYDKNEKTLYKADAKLWNKKGQYFHFKNKIVDHRAQIFLSRRFFEKLVSPMNMDN